MILLLGVAFLTSFALYVYLLSRSVYFGWMSLLAVQFYEFSFGIGAVIVGGIHLDPVDIVNLGLLAAGVIRTIPRLRERNTARLIGLAYLAIFAFSLLRGAIFNGFITAANEARGFVPILLGVLYFLTAPVDSNSVRKYIRLYIYYGVGFVIVAFLAYAGVRVGGRAWLHSAEAASNTIEDRLLPAAAALGVSLCFVFSMAWVGHRSSGTLFRWLPVIFLGTAVFLRHRSVWVVLIFSMVSLFFTDGRLFRRFIPIAVLSLVVIAAFASVASFTATPDAEDTVTSTQAEFSESASDQGTWTWRVHVWISYVLGEDQTILAVLLGKNLGDGYVSLNPEAGTWLNAPPHSEYVAEYTRVGLLGLILQLCFVIRPLTRLWPLSSTKLLAVEPSASAWTAVILGTIVYGVTYSVPPDVYALVGIASAAIANLNSEAVVPRAEVLLHADAV